MENIVGIDVGGTSIKWGRADANGKMVAFGRVPTERENPTGVLTKVADIVKAQEGVTAVGLSFPGMVGPDGSLVTAGAIRGLEGFPLKSEIEGSPDWLHSLRELVEGESRFGMHSCMMGR